MFQNEQQIEEAVIIDGQITLCGRLILIIHITYNIPHYFQISAGSNESETLVDDPLKCSR